MKTIKIKLQSQNLKRKRKKKSVNDNVVFVGIEVVAANKTSLLDEYDVQCNNQAIINVFRNKKY